MTADRGELPKVFELLLVDAPLSEYPVKQRRTNVTACVPGNRDSASVGVPPSFVAADLSGLLKAKFARDPAEFVRPRARHERVLWCRREAAARLRNTPPESFRIRRPVRSAPLPAWASGHNSLAPPVFQLPSHPAGCDTAPPYSLRTTWCPYCSAAFAEKEALES